MSTVSGNAQINGVVFFAKWAVWDAPSSWFGDIHTHSTWELPGTIDMECVNTTKLSTVVEVKVFPISIYTYSTWCLIAISPNAAWLQSFQVWSHLEQTHVQFGICLSKRLWEERKSICVFRSSESIHFLARRAIAVLSLEATQSQYIYIYMHHNIYVYSMTTILRSIMHHHIYRHGDHKSPSNNLTWDRYLSYGEHLCNKMTDPWPRKKCRET